MTCLRLLGWGAEGPGAGAGARELVLGAALVVRAVLRVWAAMLEGAVLQVRAAMLEGAALAGRTALAGGVGGGEIP